MTPDHPAKYSAPIMARIAREVRTEVLIRHHCGTFRILDPMAGTGRIHEFRQLAEAVGMRIHTVGVEIEPEWAVMHPGTIVGDSTHLPRRWTRRFDMVVTSPDYGNRMADDFEPKDKSRRIGYRFALGRPVSPASVVKPWGTRYRSEHTQILSEMERVTKDGGLVIVNASDFWKDHAVVEVVAWYREQLERLGLHKEADHLVPTARMGMGENHERRIEREHVLCYRKGKR